MRFACTECGSGELQEQGGGLRCAACGQEYPADRVLTLVRDEPLTLLRLQVRRAMHERSEREAGQLCRKLWTALDMENIGAWEPLLYLDLLALAHQMPQQLPEYIEKINVRLNYIQAEIPRLARSAGRNREERVLCLGFWDVPSAIREIIGCLQRYVDVEEQAYNYFFHVGNRFMSGFGERDDAEALYRMFAICAMLMHTAACVCMKQEDYTTAGAFLQQGRSLLEGEVGKLCVDHSKVCRQMYQELEEKSAELPELMQKNAEAKEAARRERERREAEARFAAYWEEHREEKTALEAEAAELRAQQAELERAAAALERDLEDASLRAEYDRLVRLESELMAQKARLGIFQSGPKKELKQVLADVRAQKWQSKEQLRREQEAREGKVRELRRQKADRETRIIEIKTELTKPR